MAKQKLITKTLTLPDGTRKYFRAKTEKEVNEKILQARIKMQQGINLSDASTFAELAQLWYNTYKKTQLKPRSLECIKSNLNNHVLPVIGGMPIREIKPFHAQLVMQGASHLALSTQKKVLYAMRAVFQMAVDNCLIVRTPVVSTIKAVGVVPPPKQALTREQTDALLKATQGTRVYPFILLTLYAGLRKGEALGVMWEDFDFETGTLKVRRSIVHPSGHYEGVINSDMKSAAARRDIPLPLPVLNYFRQAQKDSTSPFVLSMTNSDKHLSANGYINLWNLVERRMSNASGSRLPYKLDFYVHPHLLRHTCITRWFEAGLDIKEIQYLAGHSSVEMTLRVYTHYDKASREKETSAKIQAAVPYLPM